MHERKKGITSLEKKNWFYPQTFGPKTTKHTNASLQPYAEVSITSEIKNNWISKCLESATYLISWLNPISIVFHHKI